MVMSQQPSSFSPGARVDVFIPAALLAFDQGGTPGNVWKSESVERSINIEYVFIAMYSISRFPLSRLQKVTKMGYYLMMEGHMMQ